MIISIVAGGPVALLPDLNVYREKSSIWVGVDRGVYTLMQHDIVPDVAFGDFDSVTEAELADIKKTLNHLEIYPAEKDETDLEIAFNWALSKHPEEIYVFGATGGRMDHFIGNLQLLLKKPLLEQKNNLNIFIVDKQNLISFKTPGTYSLEAMNDKKYVSFLPISTEVKGITLAGFKYPLTNHVLPLGSTQCISNELISQCGNFSFTDGILMVIRSSD
ncbi:thiamine diphosphokinase [Peribacillus sp. JNUCC 23]|uniref:thiamine diphosphokinase n=1 Tax=Peribacillus sp. NPDC096379 TaxID=3364393 RepID=UPI003805FD3E